MKRLQIIMLLMSILLYFAPAMAQDITIQKPKIKTQIQTAPAKKSNSGTANKSSNKSTSVSEPTGYINGHGYVDLGLSVKWATCNIGATSPSDYGDYYAWGETSNKSSYTSDNSVTYGKDMGSIAGISQYDVARANWGGTWRLPTASEINELINKCKWVWVTQGGHKGYKVTGLNGNSIFLPAAGWRNGASLNFAGEIGGYWSATPNEDNTYYAYYLSFNSGIFDRGWDLRYYGQSVRSVSE